MHRIDVDTLRPRSTQSPRRPIVFARERVTLVLLAGDAYDVRTRYDSGALGFAFAAQEGEDAFASDTMRPFRRRANTLSWVPPGCEVASRSAHGGEYLLVLSQDATAGLPRDALRAALERRFNDAVAPSAIATAQDIRRTLLSGEEPDAFVLESWLDTLCATLEQRLIGPSDEALAWLTPARLEHIDKMIDERMEDGPTVRDMAAELGLSTGHFMRAFKRALGVSPHAYVLEKRLQRARRELERGGESLAEIAVACGFTHQSHMTSVMRRELGVTPGAYREMR